MLATGTYTRRWGRSKKRAANFADLGAGTQGWVGAVSERLPPPRTLPRFAGEGRRAPSDLLPRWAREGTRAASLDHLPPGFGVRVPGFAQRWPDIRHVLPIPCAPHGPHLSSEPRSMSRGFFRSTLVV